MGRVKKRWRGREDWFTGGQDGIGAVGYEQGGRIMTESRCAPEVEGELDKPVTA